ncbi:aminodeoxychorismate synthase, component I [Chromatium weissei]|nr:aminodeoxychorismate synthase, component I [Chromatium weissei]
MTSSFVQQLAYQPDSALRFAALLKDAWPVFLDSGHPHIHQGRYDILSADPLTTLVTHGGNTRIRSARGERISQADPLALVGEILGAPRTNTTELPFIGGAIGYFGYDLARRLRRLPSRAQNTENIPEMAIGFYDWALVVDHQEQSAHLVGTNSARLAHYAAQFAHAETTVNTQHSMRYRVREPVRTNMTRAQYLAAIARIQRYLVAGDCYQVNLARRFAVEADGDPWNAYQRLRVLNPAPFSAYFAPAECQVLCSSPERFLQVRNGMVKTQPIKGTCPRSSHASHDEQLAQTLQRSPKNRAENLMIVDLLRNDLGQVCIPGSIRVPQLFTIESYTRVHHLVSTITGQLTAQHSALDLLRACFPGGSITGAPKQRAMEIIEELEPQRRGVYCGAMGYLGYDGAMDTNIAIRTLIHSAGSTRFWAGGGIVADSNAADEYEETADKAAALLELLEQMRN